MKSDSNLSNKDKVKYNWNVNKDYAKYVKCNLKYKNKTYKVKGLEEVKTLDVYKRQILDYHSIELFINDGQQTATTAICTPLNAKDIYFFSDKKMTMSVEKHDIITVSYTHLDVYKRQ